MNALKIKYKADFGQLQQDVNEFDPCGLIAIGAPVDEYECLTNKILGLHYQKASRDTIRKAILHELIDHFGQDIEGIKEPYREKFIFALELLLDKVSRISQQV